MLISFLSQVLETKIFVSKSWDKNEIRVNFLIFKEYRQNVHKVSKFPFIFLVTNMKFDHFFSHKKEEKEKWVFWDKKMGSVKTVNLKFRI